ncbi:Ig-like domain-containing protein, partial [Alcanivorax sp.]|uniref:Ig-like domain-containing protein n=1 Tax=Alcanivorax sp. TaxID=1872427 RepID=UPI0032D93E85
MNALAIVVYLVGQAWAVNANGERRALKVGDQLGSDETLVVADGARIDLDFGDNQRLTFLGDQQVSAQQLEDLAVDENAPTPIEREEKPEADNSFSDPSSAGSSGGHGFVQLVRIGEIIEANGYTPVTVARIKEVLSPFGLSLPQIDFFNDDPRYSDPYLDRDEGNNGQPDSGSKLVDVSISIDVIAGNDIVDATEAAQDITVSGTVGDGVSSGDLVTVMVNGSAYETVVNADGKTWQVDVPGSELAQDNSVSATVDSVQPNGTPVSGNTERSYTADAIAPTVEVELETGSGPNGDYNDADTNDGNVTGIVTFDPATTEPGDLVKITDKDGSVLIERPITDDDIANGITLNVPVSTGQTNVELNAEVTDPVGNTGSGSDAKPVDNLTPDVDVELEPGSGSNGKYNAADTSDGEVEGTITFDPGTTFPGDKLTVTDKDGNPINDGNGVPITDYELTQDDIDNGLVVGVPVADGQTEVEINVDVTDSAGNASSDSASNPVDNVVVVAELSVDETNVFEGAPDLEYTVTLKDSDGNIVTSNNDITVTTTLGSVTITAGNSSGSFSLPVQGDDAYVDGETITNQILNAVEDSLGGSGVFENLTIDGAPIATVVSDTDDTSTVSLDNPTVAEGSDITLTATVDNAPRNSDLVLT